MFYVLTMNVKQFLHERPGWRLILACRCLMEGKISRGTFAEYLEIDRAEIDDYLDDAGFVERNYAKIATA